MGNLATAFEGDLMKLSVFGEMIEGEFEAVGDRTSGLEVGIGGVVEALDGRFLKIGRKELTVLKLQD
jgi:hypothetical protein